MPTSITIALDIMSGDNGPQPALIGAVKSLESLQDLNIILVGDEKLINQNIDTSIKNRASILHTDEYIRMDENIVNAIRNKKNPLCVLL